MLLPFHYLSSLHDVHVPKISFEVLNFVTFVQDTANPEPLVTPLDLGNEQSKNATNFNLEVPGEDRTNSAPNGNGEIPKEKPSAPANNSNLMSLDQGI